MLKFTHKLQCLFNTSIFQIGLNKIFASKAYDGVNHSLLFEKLRSRGTPTCFIRLLKHWYSTQTMRVRWANYVSEAFTVSNGVRQGGVLSPYLFSVYMDGLSDMLNNTDAGCCIGNLTLNRLMYADDLCCECWRATRFIRCV